MPSFEGRFDSCGVFDRHECEEGVPYSSLWVGVGRVGRGQLRGRETYCVDLGEYVDLSGLEV